MAEEINCTSQVAASIAIDVISPSKELTHENRPAKKLGFVDQYLTVWILGAMVLGVLVGYFSPSVADSINKWSTGGINWPIAVGLIVMMFPPLARVKYDEIARILKNQFSYRLITENITDNNSQSSYIDEFTAILSNNDTRCVNTKCICSETSTITSTPLMTDNSIKKDHFRKLIGFSLTLNWIVGPFLMFFLAIACLPDNNLSYIRGLIMVGLARCIAMVIVWNDLASGSGEYAAILVCLNSVFQILFYSIYAYFFLSVFLPLFPLQGNNQVNIHISFPLIVESVAIYLGIPFLIGFSCWLLFNQLLTGVGWKSWYKSTFIPRTAPLTLIALLFTIIVMFILKGHLIVSIPLQVVRVAVPLLIYFTVMFVGVYYCCYRFHFSLEESITLSFTSASNNFELAIAVSIAVFGLNSDEAFVGVIGPLVEVPVMLAFVHLVKVLQRWWPTKSNAHDYEVTGDVNVNQNVEINNPKNVMFLCTGNSCRSHMAQGIQ